jgi:predicted ATPase
VIRLLIQVVVQDLSGSETPPTGFEEFADSLKPLSEDLDVYMQTLWFISAPRSISVPVPDSDPQTVRRLLEKGALLLLRRFSEYLPNKVLFLDSYQFADDASLSLIESMGVISEGWPMTIISATRETKDRCIFNQVVIELDRLSIDSSRKLIVHLTDGVEVSGTVIEDVLRLSNGIPLHMIELARSLVDMAGTAGSDKSGITLPASILSAMVSRIDRLDAPGRELICQCSVQGDVFDAKITEMARRKLKRTNYPLEALFVNLESRGFIKRNQVYGKAMTHWVFCQPLMREACYQNLSLRDRRELHAHSADAMEEVYGSSIENYSAQLAMHRECAEQWRLAGEAHLLSAGHASNVFINDQAVLRYRQAVEAIDKIESPDNMDMQVKVNALAGAIRVLLRMGNYDESENLVREMQSAAFRAIDLFQAFGMRKLSNIGMTKNAVQAAVNGALQNHGIDKRIIRLVAGQAQIVS